MTRVITSLTSALLIMALPLTIVQIWFGVSECTCTNCVTFFCDHNALLLSTFRMSVRGINVDKDIMGEYHGVEVERGTHW